MVSPDLIQVISVFSGICAAFNFIVILLLFYAFPSVLGLVSALLCHLKVSKKIWYLVSKVLAVLVCLVLGGLFIILVVKGVT